MAVTESKGDGYALYGGVKLPNIDSVWTDKETCPCGTMMIADGSIIGEEYSGAVLASLVASAEQNVVNSDGSIFIDAAGVYLYTDSQAVQTYYESINIQCGLNEWGGANIIGVTSWNANEVLWVSYDLLNATDSTVYLAASDPIPLDGMNVIEWDGDTTGLVSFDDYWYKVSDEVFKPDHTFNYHLTYSGLAGQVGSGTNADFTDQSGMMMDSVNSLVISAYTADVVSETGLYFAKNVIGDYVSLFAYTPATTDEPDTEEPTWTFNKTSYLLGRLFGRRIKAQRKPKKPTAYLYNGVRLPALPEWDRGSYPYAVIAKNDYTAYLYLSTCPMKYHYYTNYIAHLVSTDDGYAMLYKGMEDGEVFDSWNRAEIVESGSAFTSPFTAGYHAMQLNGPSYECLWANYDVIDNEDGTLRVAASEPVPVYE